MNIFPLTLLMAGASALISIWLGFRVSQMRLRARVSMGDGGNEAMVRRMRTHANFAEYTPFFLILLGLVEAAIGAQAWLWAVAILFIVARLAHPFGMERPAPNVLRAGSMVVTWLVLLGLAGYAIAIAYGEIARPKITYAAAGTAAL
ncbi:MAG TPA: MAPEG family protein [Allosphingosinicella sp.]|uniref:MAPEG family protein n=1 Tax=Allosphingosinicella sp. TaxID=2823234 RepID=UPI002ED7E52E